MQFRFFVVTLLIVLLGISASAQVTSSRKDDYTQSRILILLDESSSMLQKWPSGKEKYKAADELILKIMDSVYTYNSEVEFSLRVFGHQYAMQENNCYDTKNEVGFSKSNRQQMALRLDDITPRGVTPIAYSLQEAARYDLIDESRNAYSIILITDGGESCGGDICDVMQTLMKNKIYFKPYIISLENDPQLKTTYSCMGNFLQVTRKEDINRAVGTIIEAYKPLINITPAEYKQIKTVAASVPSVLKTNIPTIKLSDTVSAKPAPLPTLKKDSVIPEVPKPHAIKVDEAWKKPAPDNINALTFAATKSLFEHKPAPPKPEIKEVPAMPVVKTEEPEAPPVVHTAQVIDKLRMAPRISKALAAPAETKLKSVDTPSVPAITIETPEPLPQPVTISKAAMAKLRVLAMEEPVASKPGKVEVPAMPSIEIPVERPKAEHYDRLVISRLIIHGFTPLEPYVVKKATVPAMPDIKVAIDTPAVPRVAKKISKVKMVPPMSAHNITVIDERNMPYQNVPPMPDIKIDVAPPPPVAATQPKPVAPKPGKPAKPAPAPPAEEPAKKVDYKLETEDAKETSVEVYFTNGKGKFYTTTPQILVMDPKTQAVVKKFYRTVDENGNPDLQNNIPVGTFDFAVTERRSLHIRNVAIVANKKNRIIFTVNPASLSFAYAEANGLPGKRPVSEFSAVVIERNKAQGRVQNQKCTEKLEYEPGNYHIEINTFPKDVRNVDIDFDESVITIAQPGFAKFVGDGKLRQVTLYQRLGDKFLAFYTLDLGDPQSQHLRMQPGEYQVHFSKGPAGVRAPEKVISFRITANQDTEVQLQ